MGTFACRCGYLIRDPSSPNEMSGHLYWDYEKEDSFREALEGLRAFLAASAEGRRDAWLASHFGADFPPLPEDADAIDEIYYKADRERGRGIIRCPECERLYVQTELYKNDWICYERAG